MLECKPCHAPNLEIGEEQLDVGCDLSGHALFSIATLVSLRVHPACLLRCPMFLLKKLYISACNH